MYEARWPDPASPALRREKANAILATCSVQSSCSLSQKTSQRGESSPMLKSAYLEIISCQRLRGYPRPHLALTVVKVVARDHLLCKKPDSSECCRQNAAEYYRCDDRRK